MNVDDVACMVLSDDSPAGALAIIRSLGRRSIPTYVAVVDGAPDVVAASRWCAGAIAIDSDAGDLTHVVDRSIAWVRGHETRRTIVQVATSDRLALALARAPDRSSDGVVRLGPTAAVAEILTSKPQMFTAARSAGLMVPNWVLIDDDADRAALEVLATLAYPVIIRPASSLDPAGLALKLAVARHPTETAALIATHRPVVGPLVVQSYKGGEGSSYEFGLCWRSARTGRADVCTGRKLLQSRPEGGFMIAGRTEPISDAEAETRRFIDHVGVAGIGGAEFVRQGDEVWFVEFNARPEAIQFLGTAAGHDYPWRAVTDLVGDDPPPLAPPARVSGWVATAAIEPLRHSPRHRWPVVRAWTSHLGARRRARQIWSWRDPLPGFWAGRRLITRAARRSDVVRPADVQRLRSAGSWALGTLAAPLFRLVRANGVRILAYHDISDPVAFGRHLDILATEYRVVSGRQVADAVRAGDRLPRRAVWITFDDGYTSVVESGLPLLTERGLTATMFVSPGVVDGARQPWWEVIGTAVRVGWRLPGDATAVDPSALIDHLKNVDDDTRRQVVAAAAHHLAAGGHTVTPVVASRQHLVTWLAHGMELGNHTWDHPCLDRCSDDEQRQQIRRADEWLDDIGAFARTRLFAYPNGDHTAVAEATIAELDYDIGLVFDHRIADPTSPATRLRMSRLQIDDRASVHRLRGNVSGANSAARRVLRRRV